MSLLLAAIDDAGTWTTVAQAVAVMMLAYLGVLWLAGIFWVVNDIRRRTADPMMQWLSIAAAALFFVPGLLLYIAIRPSETIDDRNERYMEMQMLSHQAGVEPACSNCHRRLREEFVRCPYCAWKLGEPCEACQRVNAAEWVVCPYCGDARSVVAVGVARTAPGNAAGLQKEAVATTSRNGLKPVS
jgi:RNA polymerase subunit RPABC4/transcription elongation factor Spt4